MGKRGLTHLNEYGEWRYWRDDGWSTNAKSRKLLFFLLLNIALYYAEVLFGQAQPDFRLRKIFVVDIFLNILQPWWNILCHEVIEETVVWGNQFRLINFKMFFNHGEVAYPALALSRFASAIDYIVCCLLLSGSERKLKKHLWLSAPTRAIHSVRTHQRGKGKQIFCVRSKWRGIVINIVYVLRKRSVANNIAQPSKHK